MNMPRMEIILSSPNMQVSQVKNNNIKKPPKINPNHCCPK
jgi:hypothetical protein